MEDSMKECLQLNRSSIPIEIIIWQEAVSKVFEGEAFVLANYDIEIHSPSTTMQMPSVIQLTHSNYQPKKFVKNLPFNRKNVYIRDHGHCMYCGKRVGLANFTFDHVIPRWTGGKTEWTNIVVSCIRCNSKKGGKLLSRTSMSLLREPYAPRLDKAAPVNLVNKIGIRIPEKSWEDYIYWNITLLP